MALAKDLTIDVTANLTVSDATIERCLRLLEMWQDDNKDKYIEGRTLPNGRTSYRIASRLPTYWKPPGKEEIEKVFKSDRNTQKGDDTDSSD